MKRMIVPSLFILTLLFSCSKKVVNFSGKLTYLQTFSVLNDTLSEDVVNYFERRYKDTISLYIEKDGLIRSEGKTAHLGLDFMANISLRKRSANGFKAIDSIVAHPYFELEKQNFSRLNELFGHEGVVGDDSFDYNYLLDYYTVKDSLYCFRSIQKSFRDFYFDTLLLTSKQLPVGYIVETPDFQVKRQLILVEPDDSAEFIRLNRKLRKQLN